MAKDRRVAIVAGLRTPFAKQSSAYRKLSALDLGRMVTAELLERVGLPRREIELVVYGQVVPSLTAPNIAREIVLGVQLPPTVDAYSVSRACATSYQTTVNVAEAILDGSIDCGISGGADSASDVPMAVSKKLSEALLRASKARTLGERLRAALKTLAERHKCIGDVRGLGAMVAIEFCHHGDLQKPDADLAKRVAAEAAKRGLIILTCGTWSNVVRILVPLTASNALVDEGLGILAEALNHAVQA